MHGVPPLDYTSGHKKGQKRGKKHTPASENKPDAHTHAHTVFFRVPKGPAIKKKRAKKNQKKIFIILYILLRYKNTSKEASF